MESDSRFWEDKGCRNWLSFTKVGDAQIGYNPCSHHWCQINPQGKVECCYCEGLRPEVIPPQVMKQLLKREAKGG